MAVLKCPDCEWDISDSEQERDKPIKAFSMAQVMMEDLLKAPSTADFAPFDYDSVRRIDLTTWKVKTYDGNVST